MLAITQLLRERRRSFRIGCSRCDNSSGKLAGGFRPPRLARPAMISLEVSRSSSRTPWTLERAPWMRLKRTSWTLRVMFPALRSLAKLSYRTCSRASIN